MARIDKSILTGAALAAALVGVGDKIRHAGMVTQAAKQHETVPGFLFIAWMGLTLVLAAVVHVLGSFGRETG